MSKEFERSLARVLQHEGGYVNHPADPGGATNKGITQRTYDSYRKSLGLKTRSVRLIEDREVSAIYRLEYWDKVAGDRLPAGVSYMMFDGAVNSGPSQAIKWLQRSLGHHYTGQVDGAIGAQTIAAIKSFNNNAKLIDLTLDRRLNFLQALTTWKTFGKGWATRISNVRSTSKLWASGSDSVAVNVAPVGTEKGRLSDAKTLPSTGAADGLIGAGIGSSGAGAAINEARDTLLPYADGSALVQKIVVGLIIVGLVLTATSAVVRILNKRKAKKLADALDIPVLA